MINHFVSLTVHVANACYVMYNFVFNSLKHFDFEIFDYLWIYLQLISRASNFDKNATFFRTDVEKAKNITDLHFDGWIFLTLIIEIVRNVSHKVKYNFKNWLINLPKYPTNWKDKAVLLSYARMNSAMLLMLYVLFA